MGRYPDQFSPRIDYLKFIRPMDFDRGQQVMAEIVAIINDPNIPINERDNYKFTMLNGTESSGYKSRYVIEVWGIHCQLFAGSISNDWFEYLMRIDYRKPLLTTSTKSVDAYVTMKALGRKSTRNVSTFDTKPRQKTSTRDVGGKGVIFGSRKSDSHTVIYYRGTDYPAIEMRMQNRKALDIGNNALYDFETQEGELSFTDCLMNRLKAAAMTELRAATGNGEFVHLEAEMANAQVQQNKMQAAMEWSETQEEKDYWNGLTLEEQEALQREAWIPDEILHGKRPSGK